MIKYYLDPDHEDTRHARRGLLLDRHIHSALHKTSGWKHLISKLAGELAWGGSDDDDGSQTGGARPDQTARSAKQLEAERAFALTTGGTMISPCLVTNSTLPGLGATPSGIVRGAAEAVQIMAPSLTTLAHWHRYGGGLPMKYRERLLGQILVCDLQRAHFWAWHPGCPPLHVIVEREQAALDALTERLIIAVEMIHEEAAHLRQLLDRQETQQ